MDLSYDLLSQFAKITNDTNKQPTAKTVYGTIVKQGNTRYVKLDGSELLTPFTSTASVKDGDRVLVTIKDHTALISGNASDPSASNSNVVEIGNKISKYDIIVADKIETKDIEAINGYFNNIEVTIGKYQDLSAVRAEIETLKAKYATLDRIDAVEMEAIKANIEHIKSEVIESSEITTEDLEAFNAEITNLEAYNANFTYVSAEVLKAVKANINELNTKKLDAETADIKYMDVDFGNLDIAAIKKLFADSGIIKDLIVDEGKITGELVGVTIKGDLIEGNTIKADKLVVLGSDGLYYKLNVNAETVETEQTDQNSINGSIITAKSITATKIAVEDLVAFGATIGGFHIDQHSIYSGAKASVDNTTRGVFLGDDGQIALGDSNNFLKYFQDENGNYKLEISAGSIILGANHQENENGLNVGDAIDQAQNSANAAKVESESAYSMSSSAISEIDAIKAMISNLITDEKGESLMTQTSSGWTFDMSNIQGNMEAIKNAMADINYDGTKELINNLSDIVNSVSKNTAYITMTTDDNGAPCIELGRTGYEKLGNRNYALKTSGAWSQWYTPYPNLDNNTYYFNWLSDKLIEKIQNETTTTFSFEIEFKDVTASSAGPFRVYSQDRFRNQDESIQRWNAHTAYGAMDLNAPPENGIYKMSNTKTTIPFDFIPADGIVSIRCDYWGSGSFRIRKLKWEDGDVATDWTPAYEDEDDGSDFRVRITNTSIDFMEGETRIAYASNNTFYNERLIVKKELQIGEGPGFVWRTRENGNMGLVYISG